jgi:hypothetical protein
MKKMIFRGRSALSPSAGWVVAERHPVRLNSIPASSRYLERMMTSVGTKERPVLMRAAADPQKPGF